MLITIVTANQNHQLFYCFMACRHQPYGFSFSLTYHWLNLHSLTQLIYALSLPTQRWLDFRKVPGLTSLAVTRRSTRWQKSITETIPVIWAPKDKTVKISAFKIETFHPLPPLSWFESNPSFPHYPPCRSKSHTGMAHSPHGRAETNHEARCLQLIGMNQMFGLLFD